MSDFLRFQYKASVELHDPKHDTTTQEELVLRMCRDCCCLVPEYYMEMHSEWHAAQLRVNP